MISELFSSYNKDLQSRESIMITIRQYQPEDAKALWEVFLYSPKYKSPTLQPRAGGSMGARRMGH